MGAQVLDTIGRVHHRLDYGAYLVEIDKSDDDTAEDFVFEAASSIDNARKAARKIASSLGWAESSVRLVPDGAGVWQIRAKR